MPPARFSLAIKYKYRIFFCTIKKRPLILTQHGKSAAVLLDVSVYQAIMEKLELLEEIRTGEKQILEGQYLTHEQVKERLSEHYNK